MLLSSAPDTSAPDTLQTAVVTAERGISVSRTDTIRIQNTNSISEVLSRSPGLVLADYGGFAGIKSVNLRGLGSPHTTIRIDGIKVGNVQTGQSDLGMLGLENFGATLVDYAQNSVNFVTRRPEFKGRNIAGTASVGGGSFGTFLPYSRMDFKISDRLSLSANAAGTVSKGDFGYGDGQRRSNNDIAQIRAGLDVFGIISGGEWTAKLYCNGSDRGTPGSVDYPSTDRRKDRNVFAQGFLRKRLDDLYEMNVSGKVAADKLQYFSEWGGSDYLQKEVQLNTSHKFHVLPWMDLSAVAELQWDGLQSTYYDASRTGVTAIVGASFKLPRLKAGLTLQWEGIYDSGGSSSSVASPSADFRFIIIDGLDILGFARRAFRAPTFNELYYPGYGNPELRPEDAFFADLGVEYRRAFGRHWALKSKIDGFRNHLTDKIISAPSEENPSLWLPYNIGEVLCTGLDAEAAASFDAAPWKATLCARYSFQNAEGVPYLARHSAVVSADASFNGWSLAALWNLRCGRKDSYGEMPDYNTLDVSAAKDFPLAGDISLALRISCRNIADCRYETVTGYPMPGRSLAGGVEISF